MSCSELMSVGLIETDYSLPLEIAGTENSKEFGKPLSHDTDCAQLLLYSAKMEAVDLTSTLVKLGANVEDRDQHGQTALHLAIVQNRRRAIQKHVPERNLDAIDSIVQILLCNGVDVNARTVDDFTALHYAVLFGYSKVVQTLLENGADVHSTVGTFIINPATKECFNASDQMSLLNYLQYFRSNIYGLWKNPQTTVLHFAVDLMQFDIVKMLLEKGSDVNATRFDGRTPLMMAVQERSKESEEMVRLLLENGADVDVKDSYGMTTLHYASMKNNVAVVQILLDCKAFIDPLDNLSRTPLALAVESEDAAVVKILVENRADVDRKDKHGWTPLHKACDLLDPKIVAILLRAGADVNLTCAQGKLPYQLVMGSKKRYWEVKTSKRLNKPLSTSNEIAQRCSSTRVEVVFHEAIYYRIRNVIYQLRSHFYIMLHLDLELHPLNSVVDFFNTFQYRDLTNFKNTPLTRCGKITVGNVLEDIHDPVFVLNDSLMEKLQAVVEQNVLQMDMRNVFKYVVRKAKRKVILLNQGQDWLVGTLALSKNRLPTLPRELARKVLSFLNEQELIRAMALD